MQAKMAVTALALVLGWGSIAPARAGGVVSPGVSGMVTGALVGSIFGPSKDVRLVNAAIGGVAGLLLGNQYAQSQRNQQGQGGETVVRGNATQVYIPPSSMVYSSGGQLVTTYVHQPLQTATVIVPRTVVPMNTGFGYAPATMVYGTMPVVGYAAPAYGYGGGSGGYMAVPW
ncbi:MAG: hypothetical protein HQL82_08335 [Magnetococcales bacterium]|nr:hypothetical protein [Magnetococcales bacterium]